MGLRVKNPIFKNVLSAVAVAGFGFILLNLTFIFDFLFQSLVDGAINFSQPLISIGPGIGFRQ